MKILIPLFAFSISLSSAGPREVLRILENINQSDLNQCSDDSEYREMLSPNEELLQRCAIDMCGTAASQIPTELNDETFASHVKPEVLEEFKTIEAKLNAVVVDKIKKSQKLVSTIKSKLVNGKIVPDFSKWEDWNFDSFAGSLFDEHIDYAIDATKPPSERLSLKAVAPKGATETFKAALLEYVEKKKKNIVGNIIQELQNEVYTKAEAKVFIDQIWNEFYPKYSEALKKDPEFMKEDQDLIQSLKENVETFSGDYWEASSTISNIVIQVYALKEALKDPNPGVSLPGFDITYKPACQSVKCKGAIKEHLAKFDAGSKIKMIEKKLAEKDLVKEYMAGCKSQFASLGLLDSDSQAYSDLMPEIKKRVVANVAKNYSAHSKDALVKFLDLIHLSFKLNDGKTGPFIREVENDFGSIADPAKKEDEDPFDDVGMYSDLSGYDEMGTINPLPDFDICRSELAAIIWDAFVPKDQASDRDGTDIAPDKDNILVSRYSCTHNMHGRRIMAHEIGHAISSGFKEKKFSEHSYKEFMGSRSCVNLHYKDVDIGQAHFLKHEGDRLKTEEDNADYIASLAYPEKEPRYLCALLEIKNQKYENLDLQRYLKVDTHSAPLMRIIQDALQKKDVLPASCSQLLTRYPKLGFKPCL